ncbi:MULTISPECIES: nitrate reductase cytochrome c-type subunit [Pseudomonas]|uniref:Periplasmic nitrate reductase, electron transfer subunit n=1 Tax=Pseudomonas flexibilis TaxID=706570 RepID=A0A1N6ND26_9PSED|nr:MULTISPECIES: nitrate reductase cytochrome c-type subunit [Pseudomonas]KHL70951.1 resolvase [Pseudomonas flexibilis]SIP89999.1 periplasmic nitrate reductase subunit NapB [Pseudomonas flexibilis]
MKTAIQKAVGIAALVLALPFSASAEGVKSLRETAVGGAEHPAENYREIRDAGGLLPRDFVQQPPLVPHSVTNYQVTLNYNKCMDCHSWSRAQATGATKVSLTHFRDREGQELSSVSPRRYFCLQCHVPQTDAKQLVDNVFSPAPGL